MNTTDWVGQTIGQYRIEAPLDAGGMGQVFRGVHIYLNRPAAIKVMHPHLAIDNKFRTRFLQEAQAAAALKHPNIVNLYEFGEHNDYLYMAMELITGGSLLTLLQQHSYQLPSLPFGLNLIRQAAEGLAAAHAKGIIHRDIKPDNLLLNRLDDPEEHFQVKITDFGIARLIEGGAVAATGAPIGTVAYMSPEQCRGEQVDERSDLYSLGIVLYEAVTGALPFQIDNFNDGIFKHLNTEPASPLLMRPDLPPHVEEIILRCLAKKPAERFQSCTALAQVLTEFQDEEQMTMLTMPLSAQPEPLEPEQPPSSASAEPQPPTGTDKTIKQPALPLSIAQPPEVMTLSGYEGKPRVRVLDRQGKNIYAIELTSRVLTVGRRSSCDIILGDSDISRHHLQISWDGQQVRIKDLGSGNGTFMNNTRLTPQVEQVWAERQLLQLGSYWLRLEGLGQALTVVNTGGDTPLHLRSPHIPTSSPNEQTIFEETGATRMSQPVPPFKDEALPNEPTIFEETGATQMHRPVPTFKDDPLRLVPRRASGHGRTTYTLTLRNDSNTPAHYELSGDDDELKMIYQFVPNPIDLAPGQESKVSLALHTPRHWLGQEERLPFQVHARPAGSHTSLTAPGVFVNKTLLPGWVLLTLFAAALIVGSSLSYAFGLIPLKGIGATIAHSSINPSTTVAAPTQTSSNATATATTHITATTSSHGTSTTATAGTNATPMPAPTQPNFTVTVRVASSRNPHDTLINTTVSCSSGEQMLSGGFDGAIGGTPYANYPIDGTNSWAVETDHGDPLNAYVLCLQANFDAQIKNVIGTDTVNCPAGTTLIGGGFQTDPGPVFPPVTVSAPTSDWTGWTVSDGSGSPSNVKVYARCAYAYLNGLAVNSPVFPLSNNNLNGTSAGCSNNQLLTGGGFSSQDATDPSVTIQTSAALDNTNWTVKGSDPTTSSLQVTAYALCVTPPQHL